MYVELHEVDNAGRSVRVSFNVDDILSYKEHLPTDGCLLIVGGPQRGATLVKESYDEVKEAIRQATSIYGSGAVERRFGDQSAQDIEIDPELKDVLGAAD